MSALCGVRRAHTTCCYARQDKVCVSDPAGNRWEVHTLLEDVDEDDDDEHGPFASCTPAEEGAAACC